jgi:hypothetical protein
MHTPRAAVGRRFAPGHERGKVKIASDNTLRDREISPFIIDMENNGRLSNSGIFRTKPGDVEALVSFHIGEARKKWGLKAPEPTDVAIDAHGGLTGEEAAAETAARWIPALYEAKIFPIFLMWESELWSTLKNRLQDLVTGQPRPTAGVVDQLKRFWNQRLERLLAPRGRWSEGGWPGHRRLLLRRRNTSGAAPWARLNRPGGLSAFSRGEGRRPHVSGRASRR